MFLFRSGVKYACVLVDQTYLTFLSMVQRHLGLAGSIMDIEQHFLQILPLPYCWRVQLALPPCN